MVWTKETSFHSHKLLIEHKRGEQFNLVSHDEIVFCFCFFSALILRESYASDLGGKKDKRQNAGSP